MPLEAEAGYPDWSLWPTPPHGQAVQFSPCRECQEGDGDKNECATECRARLQYLVDLGMLREIPETMRGPLPPIPHWKRREFFKCRYCQGIFSYRYTGGKKRQVCDGRECRRRQKREDNRRYEKTRRKRVGET